MTRADLMNHSAFNHLGQDTSGNPCVWLNHYRCSTCEDELPDDEPTTDSVDWQDEWSCQCNDRCPHCDTETEPYESEWIGPADPELIALWKSLEERL